MAKVMDEAGGGMDGCASPRQDGRLYEMVEAKTVGAYGIRQPVALANVSALRRPSPMVRWSDRTCR